MPHAGTIVRQNDKHRIAQVFATSLETIAFLSDDRHFCLAQARAGPPVPFPEAGVIRFDGAIRPGSVKRICVLGRAGIWSTVACRPHAHSNAARVKAGHIFPLAINLLTCRRQNRCCRGKDHYLRSATLIQSHC